MYVTSHFRLCFGGLCALSLAFQFTHNGFPEGSIPSTTASTYVPDLRAATFSGEETIDLILDAPSRTIT